MRVAPAWCYCHLIFKGVIMSGETDGGNVLIIKEHGALQQEEGDVIVL